jgi:hypothetical protein
MSGTNLIGEDYLLATHAALMEFAPALKRHVEILLNEGEVVQESGATEKSHLKFVVNLNPSDAEAILSALRIVQDNEGYDRMFNNRPVNLLVATWSLHVRRLKEEKPV